MRPKKKKKEHLQKKKKLSWKDHLVNKKARTQDRTKDQQICNLLRYHCAIRA